MQSINVFINFISLVLVILGGVGFHMGSGLCPKRENAS